MVEINSLWLSLFAPLRLCVSFFHNIDGEPLFCKSPKSGERLLIIHEAHEEHARRGGREPSHLTLLFCPALGTLVSGQGCSSA
jgi:hypothetical protein